MSLQQFLTTAADENLAEWDSFQHDGETYEIDGEVNEGPIEMVRQSDGVRFCVDVSVTVWEKQ